MVTGNLTAQKMLKKANKQYDLKAFELAAYHYHQALKDDPNNGSIMAALAQSFAYMNNDLEAVKWFTEAEKYTLLTDEELLGYGKSLKKLAKYPQAKEVFQRLKEIDPVQGEHFSMSCDYAEEYIKKPLNYEVSTFGGNTGASEFGIMPYGDNWVFCSFRTDLNEPSLDKERRPVTRLFTTGAVATESTSISMLRAPMRSSNKMGTISYSSDGQKCAVMVNNLKESYTPVFSDEEEHYILIADVDQNGDFINEKPYPHNETGSSTAFPAFAFNGEALYFSSNRTEGYGGYDLYVSYLKDGAWTLPENLGPNVNTPGNEITPYFDNHILYFASDYIHGLGGYDLFRTIVRAGEWSFPENMGNGVNSPSDDLYPYVDVDSKRIYFSSNRLGSEGHLDIFTAFKVNDSFLSFEVEEGRLPLSVPVSESILISKPSSDVAVLLEEEQKELEAEFFAVEVDEKEVKETTDTDIITQEAEVVNVTPLPEVVAETIMEQPVERSADIPAQELKTKPIIKEPTQKPEAYVLEEATPSNKVTSAWEGARMVALNETMFNGSKVYFIQLAALSKSRGSAENFRHLSKFGNIYQVDQSNLVKIRLGYFLDESEARQVLQTVKRSGYKDAFITKIPLNTHDMELMISNSNLGNSDESYMVPSKFTGKSSYKVRLASYEDPIYFDINKAKDIGKIEQWTKGGWTIFILSGFSGYEDAERAKVKAINRGWADAEVVLDNAGILERLKKN